MNDVLDEIHAAIRCCEDSETVIGTMTRAVLKETLRRATAEIERLRSALETIAIVEAGSAAAPSMRRIAVRALCVREALGDE